MTEDQREAWRKALAAKAAQQRRQRYGPQARGVRIVKGRAFTGAGMIRLRPPRRIDVRPDLPGGSEEGTTTMTEPRTQFEGEWADGSGKAVLDVGQLPAASGLRVSVSAEGGWPGLHDAEMWLSPREAVELADTLLTFAAPGAPDVVQTFGAGFRAPPRVQDPSMRGWVIRRPS